MGLALLAWIVYITQLWTYTHTRESVLDEGLYLYKGLLFVTEQFTPFQYFGVWTNHMPLSFLIPGIVQKVFGPGLATGRYFAILVAALILPGLWIVARRLAGPWWATLAVWIVALNPGMIKMYSLAVTQGLVACLIVWILVLVVGKDRPSWQIYLGALLTGIALMVRINMLPLLPLLVLYILWGRGLKTGVYTALIAVLPVIIVHAIYWPNILQIWAKWLPHSLTPFLDTWRLPQDYIRFWNPELTTYNQVLSFFRSFRFHFVSLLGVISTLILWPRRDSWQDHQDFRDLVFLTSVYISLYLLHAWATLTKNYCVFCLEGYLAFFSIIGVLIVVASIKHWRTRLPWWVSLVVVLLILVLSAGVGFSTFEETSQALIKTRVPEVLVTFPQFSLDSIRVDKVLTRKFQLERRTQKWLVSGAAGFLIGAAFVTIAGISYWVIWGKWKKKETQPTKQIPSFGYWVLVVTLGGSVLLSPSRMLGGGLTAYECAGDNIQSYRAAGEYLSKIIPPGSKVYWRGLSPAPLLYLNNIKIYAPQLNGDYSYYINGESDALLRLGFWGEELSIQWAQDADFILVQERYLDRWMGQVDDPENYQQVDITPPTATCYEGAGIIVFKRK